MYSHTLAALRRGLILVAISCNSSLFAANLQWQPLGDPGCGGRITSLAISPYDHTHIIAGGDILGLAESSDGGNTWPGCFGIQGTYEFEHLTFHPTDTNTIWAASMGGPWKSVDKGKNWVLARAGFPATAYGTYVAPVEQIVFDPSNSSRLLAVTGNQRGYSGANANTHLGEVYASTDSGNTWALLSTPAGGHNIYNAIFKTGDANTLFISTSVGLYRSGDKGSTWTQLTSGLPAGGINWVAVSPANGNTLWAISAATGVYKSNDGGNTFAASSSGLPTSGQNYRVIGVAPTNASVLYTMSKDGNRGIWHSTDAGATWTKCTINNSSPYPIYSDFDVLAIDPTDANTAFAGTNTDIWRTSDGVTWYNVTATKQASGTWGGNGFSGEVGNGMNFNPYNTSEWMMCAMDSGKWLSRDGFQSFSFAGGNRGSGMTDWNGVTSVAFTNTSGTSEMIYSTGDSHLRKTGNGGGSWANCADPTTSGSYGGVYADPNRPNRVWVVKNGALWYSQDSAATWTRVATNAGTVKPITAAKDASTIYIGSNTGVYQSTDGVNFTLAGSSGPQGVTGLRLDPVTPGRLYAINRDYVTTNTWSTGLWKFDAGSWSILSSDGAGPIANIVDAAIDPTDNTRILAATNVDPFTYPTSESGVWMKEGSNAWKQQNAGLSMLRVKCIAFRPDNSGTVVCGTNGRGYFIANTSQFAASRDTYARAGSYANGNFGTEDQLVAKTSSSTDLTRQSYFYFDLSTLGASVTKAVLNVTVQRIDSGPATFEVDQVSTDVWTETGLTWNNRPSYVFTLVSQTLSTTGTFQFDVTGYVNSQLSSDKTVSLELKRGGTVATEAGVWMSSREGLQPPVLVITK